MNNRITQIPYYMTFTPWTCQQCGYISNGGIAPNGDCPWCGANEWDEAENW